MGKKLDDEIKVIKDEIDKIIYSEKLYMKLTGLHID